MEEIRQELDKTFVMKFYIPKSTLEGIQIIFDSIVTKIQIQFEEINSKYENIFSK